jgi:hypothetical protein
LPLSGNQGNTNNRVSKGTIVLYIEIEEEASGNILRKSLTGRTMQNTHPQWWTRLLHDDEAQSWLRFIYAISWHFPMM